MYNCQVFGSESANGSHPQPIPGAKVGVFEVDLQAREVRKAGMRQKLRPRSPRSVPRSGRTAQEVRQERRLRLLRGNRLSAWEPISQIIAQLLVRSWDNGWDNRRGSTCDRIALKRRQRNELVGFELFLRSQTLYPLSYGRAANHFTVNSYGKFFLRFQLEFWLIRGTCEDSLDALSISCETI